MKTSWVEFSDVEMDDIEMWVEGLTHSTIDKQNALTWEVTNSWQPSLPVSCANLGGSSGIVCVVRLFSLQTAEEFDAYYFLQRLVSVFRTGQG